MNVLVICHTPNCTEYAVIPPKELKDFDLDGIDNDEGGLVGDLENGSMRFANSHPQTDKLMEQIGFDGYNNPEKLHPLSKYLQLDPPFTVEKVVYVRWY